MDVTLHHIATGIQGSVYAYQHQTRYESSQKGGLQGWRAVKIVRAGPSGKLRGLKPHNVLREVLVLDKAKNVNVRTLSSL